jgi:hypothetical protein
MQGSAKATSRGLLALSGILLFARMYYIINESKRYRKTIILAETGGNDRIERRDVEELAYIFALFLLVLAGMPLLR